MTADGLAALRPTDPDGATARYVFRLEIGSEPDAPGLWTDPGRFETTLYRAADEPGTDGAYLDALKAAIADDLPLFNADSVSAVLNKYLGSSIRVVTSGDAA